MIIPQYWAEGRAQHRRVGKQVTVRRFGWSDISAADAQVNAEYRAQDALQRILSGESLIRREPKVPYHGAEGVPIREEILGRHEDVVITRNSYGAICLNTPDVLFVDIDYQNRPSKRMYIIVFAVLLVIAISAGIAARSWLIGIVLTILILLVTGFIASIIDRLSQLLRGEGATLARQRIDKFLKSHPQWGFRLYRTPAGLRAIATHHTFQPDSSIVQDCFKTLGADPLYIKMCLRQQCFRARVSAKPWRIGLSAHLRPRPGVWPVDPERLPDRVAWVEKYTHACAGYAACAYLVTVGSGIIDAKVKRVIELHDELSKATSSLPIA